MSTDQHLARVPSPEALPSGGRLPRLAAQVASEVTRYRRLPEYFLSLVIWLSALTSVREARRATHGRCR